MKTNPQKQFKITQIFKNFSYLTAGKILADLFTFCFFIVLTNTFGQTGIGQYSFAMALTGFFTVFCDFGLSVLSIKEMSRLGNSLGEYFGQIFLLRIILSLCVIIMMILLIPFFGFSGDTLLIIFIIGLYQLLYSLVTGFLYVFIAKEETHFAGGLEFSLKMSIAVLGVTVVFTGGGFLLAISVMPLVSFLHLLIAYWLVTKKYGTLSCVFSVSLFKERVRTAFPYALSALLNQINTRMDVVFLGFLMGANAAGIYNVAYRVVSVMLFLPRFVGLSLFPLASRLYLESPEKCKELYNHSLNLCCLIGLPIGAGLWLIAPELIDLFFGKTFVESVLILQLLSWLLLFIFFRGILGVFLTSCDRQQDRTRSQMVAAISNLLGNSLLIPLLGVKGAAIATLGSEVLVVFLFVVRLEPVFGWPAIGSRLLMAGVATAGFTIPALLFPGIHLFFLIGLLIFCYLGILLLFREFREKEFQVLVGVLKKSKKGFF